MTVKRWMLISMVVLSLTGIVLASTLFPSLQLAPSKPQDSLSKSMTVYAYGPSGLLSKQVGGEVFYYHTDYLSSSSLVTDKDGEVVYRSDYEPFGSSLHEQGEERYTYTGKELDDATGLYYYGARYYDASLGRSVSVDPVQGSLYSGQRLNRYMYVLNNPMRYTDPSGASLQISGDKESTNKLTKELNALFDNDLFAIDDLGFLTLQPANFDLSSEPEKYKIYELFNEMINYKKNQRDLFRLDIENGNDAYTARWSTIGLGLVNDEKFPFGEGGKNIDFSNLASVAIHELYHHWYPYAQVEGLKSGEEGAVQYENYARTLASMDNRVYYRFKLMKDAEGSVTGVGLITPLAYDAANEFNPQHREELKIDLIISPRPEILELGNKKLQ